MLITSLSNATVKQIRALRQRKERERTGLAFAEGVRLVGEAVALAADQIEQLVVAPDLLTRGYGRELAADWQRRGAPLLEVSAEVFASLSHKDGPQGLGAVVRQRWEPLAAVRPGPELCWIALDAAQDPGNLGTILRTADAVGAAGLLLLGHAADPYDPAALRASMGAIFAQRLVRTTFADLLRWKTRHACALVGTSDAAPTDYQAVTYPHPLVLLLGSEREGLAPEQQSACDLMVSLPMVGRGDSLNLAVATGILLYELFSQRRRAGIR